MPGIASLSWGLSRGIGGESAPADTSRHCHVPSRRALTLFGWRRSQSESSAAIALRALRFGFPLAASRDARPPAYGPALQKCELTGPHCKNATVLWALHFDSVSKPRSDGQQKRTTFCGAPHEPAAGDCYNTAPPSVFQNCPRTAAALVCRPVGPQCASRSLPSPSEPDLGDAGPAIRLGRL